MSSCCSLAHQYFDLVRSDLTGDLKWNDLNPPKTVRSDMRGQRDDGPERSKKSACH